MSQSQDACNATYCIKILLKGAHIYLHHSLQDLKIPSSGLKILMLKHYFLANDNRDTVMQNKDPELKENAKILIL